MGNILRVLILSFIPITITAQVYDFGDIPDEHLQMEVYDKDSMASAVVLFEIGNTELNYVNGLFQLSTENHIRIKILNDEALDLADISIDFRHGDSEQKIDNVKASSFCVDDRGEVQETRLGRRDKFTEKVSENWSEYKFSIPNVRAGCIIEYEYELKSENPLDFPDWYFQGEYPILWSEYKTKIPEFFKFLTLTRGYQEYFIQEESEFNERYTLRPSAGPSVRAGERNAGRSNQGMQDFMVEGVKTRHVMKDVPAIKDEPYMKARTDYLAHVRYQLAGVEMPGSMPNRVIKTWEEVVADLDEYRNYGDRLKSSRTLQRAAREATDGLDTNLDKMVALYNHVQDKITWDERYRVYMNKSLEEYYNEGIAPSSAMNFVLIQLLREVGLEAYPVLVSTAANGEIIGLFPENGQFNSTITYVAVDGNYYLLDPKNKYRPYTILPFNIIGTNGLMLFTDQLIWLPIDQIVKNTSFKNVAVSLATDSIRAQITTQLKGLYAVNMGEMYSNENFQSSLSNRYFGSNSSYELSDLSVKSDDVITGFDIDFTIKREGLGDYSTFYFNPMVMDRLGRNPFNLDQRTYPIDYNYPFDESIVMNITIPEGWVVDELPQPVLYRLPGRTGEFRRIIRADGNQISMSYRFKIDKIRFMPDEYEILKGMYDQMVTSLAENIVLKKES